MDQHICVCAHMLYIHVCGVCVCEHTRVKEGILEITFEQNQPRCARKNMLHFFPPVHLKK